MGKNYKEFDIFLEEERNLVSKLEEGTFIYQKNSVTEGRNQRDKKYHFFRITGKGKFEIRLQDLYSSEFRRAPFDNQIFRDEFEKNYRNYSKLITFKQKTIFLRNHYLEFH